MLDMQPVFHIMNRNKLSFTINLNIQGRRKFLND